MEVGSDTSDPYGRTGIRFSHGENRGLSEIEPKEELLVLLW